MPQKLAVAALVLCAAFARAGEYAAEPAGDQKLHASYQFRVFERDELALWGSLEGSEAALELGGAWTRERLELALVFGHVFEGDSAAGLPRNLCVRVKYSF